MHLPPDFLPHPAGHLHAPDGWHDGGRWPHSTRGEVQIIPICSLPHVFGFCFFSLLSNLVSEHIYWNGFYAVDDMNNLYTLCQASILGDPPKDVNLPQGAFLNVNTVFPSGEFFFLISVALGFLFCFFVLNVPVFTFVLHPFE